MLSLKPLAIAMAALSSISTAAPTISERAVQSCTCKDFGPLLGEYDVYIGIHYADGKGCANVHRALDDTGAGISSFKCVEAKNGNTQLYFNAVTGNGKEINSALHHEYPTVNGFNCPDY